MKRLVALGFCFSMNCFNLGHMVLLISLKSMISDKDTQAQGTVVAGLLAVHAWFEAIPGCKSTDTKLIDPTFGQLDLIKQNKVTYWACAKLNSKWLPSLRLWACNIDKVTLVENWAIVDLRSTKWADLCVNHGWGSVELASLMKKEGAIGSFFEGIPVKNHT